MTNGLPSIVIGLYLSLVASLSAQQALPSIYIDHAACPFECCTYGKWRVVSNTTLLAESNPRSGQVAMLQAGDTVQAITGEVRTHPTPFLVESAFAGDRERQYAPGDTLWLLTYLGEGYFRVWWKGQVFEEDMGFSPYGGTPGSRCEHCRLGTLLREHRSEWWIKVGTATGIVGWTRESTHFTGADGCG